MGHGVATSTSGSTRSTRSRGSTWTTSSRATAPVTDLKYLQTQKAVLLEWKARVADAVAKGWSREETIERVNMRDRYPVDIGQEYMMDYIQSHNAGILWDRLSANEV